MMIRPLECKKAEQPLLSRRRESRLNFGNRLVDQLDGGGAVTAFVRLCLNQRLTCAPQRSQRVFHV